MDNILDDNKKGSRSGMYKPSGVLQGDTSDMPDKGTGTGVTNTYGASISQSATNRRGSMHGASGDNDGDGMRDAEGMRGE